MAEVLVHHVDGNHKNLAVSNLKPAHRGCNGGHHDAWGRNRGGWRSGAHRDPQWTEEAKRKARATHLGSVGYWHGKQLAPEHCARISEGMRRAYREGRHA
jgi:hypothetical protein